MFSHLHVLNVLKSFYCLGPICGVSASVHITTAAAAARGTFIVRVLLSSARLHQITNDRLSRSPLLLDALEQWLLASSRIRGKSLQKRQYHTCAVRRKECRRGAHLPSLGREPVGR